MTTPYLITYDLRAPGRNYQELYKLLGTTWHAKKIAESVWLAELFGPAKTVRDIIRKSVDRNDRVVVVELPRRGDWATLNAIAGGADWLQVKILPRAA